MQTIQLQPQKIVNLEVIGGKVIYGQSVIKSIEFRDILGGSPCEVIVKLDMYEPHVRAHDEGN